MRTQRGMTLIEVMIGLGIVTFLLAVGMPSFARWLQDAQNRTAAESVLNGLQLARMEALRRNAQVRFRLTDSNGKVAWSVGCKDVTVDCPAVIQSRLPQESGPNARVGVSKVAIPRPTPVGHFGTAISSGTGLAADVIFDGTGRAPDNSGTDIKRIDITNATTSVARRYVLTISPGGQVRMCDPALAFASNPQGCS